MEIDIDDLGWINVTIEGFTQRLDLYETQNRISDLHAANKTASAGAYNEALLDLLTELGFPRPSQYVAVRFCEAIFHACEGVKKKADLSAASQGSTTSTPSN